MLNFSPITLADRPWIHEIFFAAGRPGCEYSFANLLFWTGKYGGVARVGDFLCQESCYGGKCSYFFPAGAGDPAPVLEALRRDAEEKNVPFILRGVTLADKEVLEALYPGKFRFTELRNTWDYVYPTEKLANLTGKKLQSKRNHINRFVENHPQWHTVMLTADNLSLLDPLLSHWYESHEGESLTAEHHALDLALSHFDQLEMVGLALHDGEKIVAFSMGNRIGPETFDVNFEKAYADIQGAYPTINREFARMVAEKFPDVRWLNREDDMGLAGLRKAKESYYPDLLVKHKAVWDDAHE